MTATVIVPTTGNPLLKDAISSVLDQTYHSDCYVVVDGSDFFEKANEIIKEFDQNPRLKVCYLPTNVGKNGFYGHRVYAGFTHLINTDFVLYLDQDNWLEKDHVDSCVSFINTNKLDWCYSLRKIYKNNDFVCKDDCESLGIWPSYMGYHHIDTNTFCLSTKFAIKCASYWHGGWGQDRTFFNIIKEQNGAKWGCTGLYSVNYRVGGNAGSVDESFFLIGNQKIREVFSGGYPWENPANSSN